MAAFTVLHTQLMSAYCTLPLCVAYQVKLSDYQKQGKYVVLFFYPLDFTFVCPTGKSHFPIQAYPFEPFKGLAEGMLGLLLLAHERQPQPVKH